MLFFLLGVFATVSASAPEEPRRKPDTDTPAPQAVVYFNIGANTPKNTVLPTGTRVRVHIATANYQYCYDCETVAGETFADIAEQVCINMKDAGWKVDPLANGSGFTVFGRLPTRAGVVQAYETVQKVGISYSTAAQPEEPSIQGGVKLLVLEKDKWKSKPEKK